MENLLFLGVPILKHNRVVLVIAGKTIDALIQLDLHYTGLLVHAFIL